MAKDVEWSGVYNDKTDAGLRKTEANFARSARNIKKENDKLGDGLSKGLGGSILKGIAKVSPKLAETVTNSLSLVSGKAVPILAGIGVAAAPLLGAAVSGAIIGGVGIGGVLGGVALVAKDARVAAAGKTLGQTLLSSLQEDASPFIAPVLEAIETIESRFEKLRPLLQNIFSGASRFVEPLVEGLLGGIEGILAGVDRLISQGGPVIDAFGDLFTSVGQDIGEAFAIIAGGSQDSADAIRVLAIIIGESVLATARLVRGLTEIFGGMVGLYNAVAEVVPGMEQFNTGITRADESNRRLGSGTFGTAQGLQFQAQAADEVTAAVDAAKVAVDGLYVANNNLYASETNFAAAVANATKVIDKNGKTLSLNSQKGRENREALSNAASAAQRQYDAFVKVNGVGPQSAAVADNLRTKFIALAQKAGLSSTAAKDLANKLLNIPEKRETKITAKTAQAISDINATKDALNRVNSKTVTLTVNVNAPRLNAVQNRLDRSGGGFSAAGFMTATSSGTTGGAKQVNQDAPVLYNTVFIDGVAYAARQQASQVLDEYKHGIRYGRN